MSDLSKTPQPVRKRRNLSAEKKYQILVEIKANPEKKGEILRCEGLYSSDLLRYENAAKEGTIKGKNCTSLFGSALFHGFFWSDDVKKDQVAES